MCGRYVIARATGDLAATYGAEVPEGVEVSESWNVAPSTLVPIIRETDAEGHRELNLASWGLLPGWAKDLNQGYKSFNARSETAADKPTFRAAVRSKRAVIPADAYYEWVKDGSKKRPHVIRPADGSLMSFAGLYEWWHDPAAEDEAPALMSCTILTGPAPEPGSGGVLDELAGLHDRIPLPVTGNLMQAWLSPERLEKEEAAGLVEAVREDAYGIAAEWELYEVGQAVGNVRNNHSSLLEPAQYQRLF